MLVTFLHLPLQMELRNASYKTLEVLLVHGATAQ